MTLRPTQPKPASGTASSAEACARRATHGRFKRERGPRDNRLPRGRADPRLASASTKGGNTVYRHRPSVETGAVKTLEVLGIVGLLLLGVAVPRADASIGGSETLTWPATAQVGS